MSQAFRCNSCKEFFVPDEIGDQEFCRIGEISFQNSDDYRENKAIYQNRIGEYIDLCPTCAKTMMIWLGVYDEIQKKKKEEAASEYAGDTDGDQSVSHHIMTVDADKSWTPRFRDCIAH